MKRSNKPRLVKMEGIPLWKCETIGMSALGDTPAEAYDGWLRRIKRRAKPYSGISGPKPYSAPP